MLFTELVEKYPEGLRLTLADLMLSFISIEKRLNDLSLPGSKGKIVEEAREVSGVLKDPPWDLSVDFLWKVYLDIEDYESQIKNWLADTKPNEGL